MYVASALLYIVRELADLRSRHMFALLALVCCSLAYCVAIPLWFVPLLYTIFYNSCFTVARLHNAKIQIELTALFSVVSGGFGGPIEGTKANFPLTLVVL